MTTPGNRQLHHRPLLPTLLVVLSVILSLGMWRTAAAQTLRERIEQRLDTNKDGTVSDEERASARRLLRDRLTQPESPDVHATIDASNTALYKAAPGPHALATIKNYTFKDPHRERPIPLRITMPKLDDGEPAALLPLLIFCHGALGSKDAYQPLVTHWASHGYIVVQPTFGDSLTEISDADKANIRSIAQLVNSEHVTSQWDDRPQEVIAILDHLDAIEEANPILANRIDRERVGVAGHSFGAHTSMMLLGMELFAPASDEGIAIDDPRIKAAVIISPQGPGRSLRDTSYANIDRPALFITGDNDGSPMRGQENLAGDWRRKAFDLAPKAPHYLLWLNDAHHNFGGITGATWPGAGPNAPDQILLIASTALVHLDAHVRNDEAARAYLQSDVIEKEAGKIARLERK